MLSDDERDEIRAGLRQIREDEQRRRAEEVALRHQMLPSWTDQLRRALERPLRMR